MTIDIQTAVRTIYTVRTKNFIDDLYYRTLSEALDFVRDQVQMDYFCTIRQDRVDAHAFDNLMATMTAAPSAPDTATDVWMHRSGHRIKGGDALRWTPNDLRTDTPIEVMR